MFTTWVWQRAGVPGVPRGIQRARGLGLWATDKGLFKPRAPGTDGHPEVGDWVVWGAPSARGQGHVDVVTRVGGGRIDVIGGNLDDAVRLRTIDPATATVRRAGQRLAVSGYVTPPGLGASPPGEPAGTTPGSLDGVVAVTRGVGQLDVFVRGGSFALMHRHWNGRAWGCTATGAGVRGCSSAAPPPPARRRSPVTAPTA